MDALLGELSRDQTSRRFRLVVACLVGVAAVVAAVGGYRFSTANAARVCSGGGVVFTARPECEAAPDVEHL